MLIKLVIFPETLYKSLADDGENLNRLINGYIGFLKKSKQGANEPGANYSVREDSVLRLLHIEDRFYHLIN